LLLAQWTDALLLRMVSGASSGPPSIHLDLQPDMRVLGFTLGVTLLTTILFGLIPSLYSTRLNLTPVLKSTPTGTSSEATHRRFPVGKILVVTQVAVSVILLVSAGLFVRSISKLGDVKLGYNLENLILFRVDGAPGGYKGAAIPASNSICWQEFPRSPVCAARPFPRTVSSAARNRLIRSPSKATRPRPTRVCIHAWIMLAPHIFPRSEFPS